MTPENDFLKDTRQLVSDLRRDAANCDFVARDPTVTAEMREEATERKHRTTKAAGILTNMIHRIETKGYGNWWDDERWGYGF